MITEKEYVNKISIDHRKKYAQFFTPEQISDFMASWVVGSKKGMLEILDPAFGLGVFSRSLYKLNPQIRVVGYDIDKLCSILQIYSTFHFLQSHTTAITQEEILAIREIENYLSTLQLHYLEIIRNPYWHIYRLNL